jgi:hypothetical protein
MDIVEKLKIEIEKLNSPNLDSVIFGDVSKIIKEFCFDKNYDIAIRTEIRDLFKSTCLNSPRAMLIWEGIKQSGGS